jgi:hypothetical protein
MQARRVDGFVAGTQNRAVPQVKKWMFVSLLLVALGLVVPPAGQATAAPATVDAFDGSALGAGWTIRDGYAQQHPSDTANHATFSVGDGRLAIAFPGGAEHNQWWLQQAEVLRPYEGSGTYQIKVDSAFTGSQQVGLSFESSPGTFLQFMLYSTDQVRAFVERFVVVNGTLTKQTVVGANTGIFVPNAGPYYLRVSVADNAIPSQRIWTFHWSTDAITWTQVSSGALEGNDASTNIGAVQTVGVFAGNQPPDYSAFEARVDYFIADDGPITEPLTEPFHLSGEPGNGTASLTWSQVVAAESYGVYRASSEAGPWVEVGTTTTPSFVDSGLTNGTTYVYAVTASAGGVESGRSAPVSVVPAGGSDPGLDPSVPTDGLIVSLNASQAATQYADGAPVTTWTNGAGTTHATAAGDSRPTLAINAIGAEPAIRFDGSNDHFTLGAGFEDFTNGVTTFVVAKPTILQTGFKLVALGNGPGQQGIVLGRNGNTNGLQYFVDTAGGTGWFNTNDALVTNQPTIFTVAQPGGTANSPVTATVAANGTTVGSGTTYVPPIITRTNNLIGKSYWNEGRFQGDIAQILIYNRTLTASETQAVHTYLANKYGIGTPPPPQPPAAPTGLAATAGNATVALTWNAVTGATDYTLLRSTDGTNFTTVTTTAATNHTDTGLTNGTTYTYTVRANGPGGQSPNSATAAATPTAPPPYPGLDPSVPTNGLIVSLDAAQAATQYANGAPVTTWTNGAGTAQATATGDARPTLATNAINGQAAIRFDGTDDHFALGSGFDNFTNGVTTFVVAKPTTLQSGFKLVALGNGPGQQGIVLGRAGNSNGLQYFVDNASGSTAWFNTNDALVANQTKVFAVTQPGGTPNSNVTATVTANGTIVGSGNSYVPPTVTRTNNLIGKSYWNEGRFQGDIAQILIYNRTLTPAETDAVHTYLANKYGL